MITLTFTFCNICAILFSMKQAAEPHDILTVSDVADLLRVSEGWVHEKCRRRAKNPLPAHAVGRYLRFRRSEVLAWFDGTVTLEKRRKSAR